MADMAPESVSKRQRLCQETNEDRISSLPDVLQFHILSFLSTQEAVRTSLLSTSWRYLWTYVPCLEFKERPYFSRKFRDDIVESVLLLHQAPSMLRLRLHFVSSDHNPNRINSWISTVITRNLVELDLKFFHSFGVNLPESLFSLEKLAVLKLEYNVILNVPAVASLPCLKILHLKQLLGMNKNAIEKILSTALVLEELIIYEGRRAPKTLCIRSSSLKKLKFYSYLGFVRQFSIQIDLDTPNLGLFEIRDHEGGRIYNVMNNLGSLVRSAINFGHARKEDCEKLMGFLTKIMSSVEILDLAGSAFQHVWQCGFPPSLNLTCLSVEFWEKDWPALPLILNYYVNLEDLVILKMTGAFRWSSPKNVPECMLLRLKIIELHGFGGCRKVMKMVGYLLRNSMVLEKLTFSFATTILPRRRSEIAEKMLMLPRVSTACIIEFS